NYNARLSADSPAPVRRFGPPGRERRGLLKVALLACLLVVCSGRGASCGFLFSKIDLTPHILIWTTGLGIMYLVVLQMVLLWLTSQFF
uniref:Uncharacterized protein n=1 Tax=Triticum urartu TaxID=4572 RepID=A0A8R7V6R6_TRIUA